MIGAGLVAPWGDIEYDEQALGAALERRLGFPVESWELVPAIAAAEYLARSEDLPGSTMYLYSRNTVAFVMANQRPAGTEIARVGRLSHFPIGGVDVCRCGQTGCLENAVSDEAVAAKAASAGVIGTPDIELVHRAAARGDQVAHRLLCARAAALGRVAAVVRDITNPDRVVLCGQGLTGYGPALEVTRAHFAAHTATAREIGISFTRFAGDINRSLPPPSHCVRSTTARHRCWPVRAGTGSLADDYAPHVIHQHPSNAMDQHTAVTLSAVANSETKTGNPCAPISPPPAPGALARGSAPGRQDSYHSARSRSQLPCSPVAAARRSTRRPPLAAAIPRPEVCCKSARSST